MRRFFSPSMVVAMLALIVSLSGVGVAAKVASQPPNSVGTQQIVNGSIRLTDLHPSAVKSLKGRTGPQGEMGDKGATGPVGPAGLPGGFDLAKISYTVSGAVSMAAYTISTAVANCPSGSKAIGGWGLPSQGRIIGMGPTAGYAGWAISVTNDTSINTTIAAGAVCAAP